jgi:hypothetical protein
MNKSKRQCLKTAVRRMVDMENVVQNPYKGVVGADAGAGLTVGAEISFKEDGNVVSIHRSDGVRIGTLFALDSSKELIGRSATIVSAGFTCTAKVNDKPDYVTIYVNYPVNRVRRAKALDVV